jgi:hypothetical protein
LRKIGDVETILQASAIRAGKADESTSRTNQIEKGERHRKQQAALQTVTKMIAKSQKVQRPTRGLNSEP